MSSSQTGPPTWWRARSPHLPYYSRGKCGLPEHEHKFDTLNRLQRSDHIQQQPFYAASPLPNETMLPSLISRINYIKISAEKDSSFQSVLTTLIPCSLHSDTTRRCRRTSTLCPSIKPSRMTQRSSCRRTRYYLQNLSWLWTNFFAQSQKSISQSTCLLLRTRQSIRSGTTSVIRSYLYPRLSTLIIPKSL